MRGLIALLVAAVVVCGGYYVFWHKKADQFKQTFSESVASINNSTKPQTKDLALFRYDSVEMTGFPTNMQLEIYKPVLDVPVSALVDESQKKQHPGETHAASPYEWVEEFSYSDRITITRDMMGEKYTVSFYGDRKNQSLINRKARHTVISSTPGPLVCHLSAEQPIFSDLSNLLSTFRKADCSVDNVTLKDGTSGATLYTLDSLSGTLGHEPESPINHKFDFSVDTGKAKYTPAFDPIYKDYMLMYYTLLGKQDVVAYMVPPSEYGQQTSKISVHYDGPTHLKDFADPNLQLHLDANATTADSPMLNYLFKLDASTAPQGADRTVSLKLNATGQAAQTFDALIQKVFTSVFVDMSKPASDKPQDVLLAQKMAAIGNPAAAAEKISPKISTLGKMTLDIDLNIKGPNQGLAVFKRGVITLDDFSVLTSPYSLTVKGSSNGSIPNRPPLADFSLSCTTCDTLVNDLGTWLGRFETTFNGNDPTKQPFFTPDLIMSVRQFLHGISESPSTQNISIHFVMNNAGSFTISGKQLPEVLAIYMNTIQPHVKPSPASSGGSMQPMPGE